MDAKSHRATLFIEQVRILARTVFPGEQVLLRLLAPRIAATALPGTFLHIRCDPQLPLRRPISLMSSDPIRGELTLLFKVVGNGTRLLAAREVGDILDILGPVGVPFRPYPDRPRTILIGGGVGIPPMVFFATRFAQNTTLSWDVPVRSIAPTSHFHRSQMLLLMGSEVPFPFSTHPSRASISGIPEYVTAAMVPLQELGIHTRLASQQGYSGCFQGLVTELARLWLQAQSPDILQQVALYACGPKPMLRATADLAYEYDLPCQVCLEEFMACGVGACAGCVVPVKVEEGTVMKRVCVDGPVFEAKEVF